MEYKISLEAAEKEWREFLEENDAESLIPNNSDDSEEAQAKKIGFQKIVKAIAKGFVVIEDGIVKQTLKFPIKSLEGKVIVGALVFNGRWTASDREDIMKEIDSKDSSTAFRAQRKLCSKITGIDAAFLGKLDSFDMKITDQIVTVFFM